VIDAGRATVFGLSAIHALWATGSPFPFADQKQLANAVQGTETVPNTAWCLAVSAGLALGAARAPRLTAAAFAARGVVGLARPQLLPAGDKPPFATLNARLYSPGCLLIAAALARATRAS
jgi:hypothetical protein